MTADAVPSGLHLHPAWIEWKKAGGWRSADSGLGFPLLVRDLPEGGTMARCVFPPPTPGLREEGVHELGAALERLSQRMLAQLPGDCAFIRWDVMLEAWSGGQGAALEPRLQELRMNASTRWRRLRKAPADSGCASTMLVELDGPERLRSRMSARARHALGLAERRGTAVSRVGEEGLDAFQALHEETAARHGLEARPASAFRGLFSAARAHGLALDLYLAESGGEAAAAAIFARHREEAWYLFAASSRERRSAAGPSAILYRAMVDSAASGARRMDLLGAAPPGEPSHPLAGVTRFKEGFGGRRMTRAGAWDLALRPNIYARHARAEAFREARRATR